MEAGFYSNELQVTRVFGESQGRKNKVRASRRPLKRLVLVVCRARHMILKVSQQYNNFI